MKKFLQILVLIGLLVLSACSNEITSPKVEKETLTVVASFYPLAEFARGAGGDLVEVINITPAGVGAHDFEPTPKDIALIYKADIFVYNGAGNDPWAEKIAEEVKENDTLVIKIAESLTLIELTQGDEDHNHENDPHIWLDPTIAMQQVDIIHDALIQTDPENSEQYKENASNYINQLANLHTKFKEGLETCENKDIVVSHAAFAYLAKQYNLNQIAIAGLSPEEEPSAKKLGEISKLAKEKNIKYIFFETLTSPILSETIANEIGAETLVLNPLGGLTKDELAAGKTYITVMEDNLKNLQTALNCQT